MRCSFSNTSTSPIQFTRAAAVTPGGSLFCSVLHLLVVVYDKKVQTRIGAGVGSSSPKLLTPTPCTVLKSTLGADFLFVQGFTERVRIACGYFFFCHMLVKAHLSKWLFFFFNKWHVFSHNVLFCHPCVCLLFVLFRYYWMYIIMHKLFGF